MCDQSESTKRTAELAKLMRDPRAVMALIAENKALKAKTETYCTYGDEGSEHTYYGDQAAIAALTALVFEVEALRKNVDRYQWLRGRDLETVRDGGIFAGMTPENVILNGLDLDQRIDYAMTMGEQS